MAYSIEVQYPSDITADEMKEIAERFGLFPFLAYRSAGTNPVIGWSAIDGAERMALGMLDELAEMLGAHWELNTSTNKITITRKGGDDEGTDEDDQPEAA